MITLWVNNFSCLHLMMKILFYLSSNNSLKILKIFNMLEINRASNIMSFMWRQIKRILIKSISLTNFLNHKKADKFKNFIIKFWCSWEISEWLINLLNFLLSYMTLSSIYEKKMRLQDHLKFFNNIRYACRSDDLFSKNILLKNHNINKFQSDWFWLIW